MKKTVLFVTMMVLAGFITEVSAQITILSGFQGATYYEMSKDLEKIAGKSVQTKPKTIQVANPETGELTDSIYMETTETDLLTVLTSDGAYYNFIKLEKTDIDVTFLQYDVLLYEEMQDLTRKFKKTENIRILLSMGSEQIHLIARKDSKISKLADLKGKQIGIGSSMQGTNITAKFIKEKTKIPWNDVEIPYDRAFRALLVGDIEAFFFIGAAPVSSLNKLSPNLKDQIKMIPVKHEKLDPVYKETKLTSKEYSWIDTEISTYSIPTVLVTSIAGGDKSEKIDKFLGVVKENLPKLKEKAKTKQAHPQWEQVSFKDDAIEWEFHPLAKKYQ